MKKILVRLRRGLLVCIVGTGILNCQQALADCNGTGNSNLSFGSITSFAIAAVPSVTSTPDAGLNCDGPTILGLLGSDRAEATATSTNSATLIESSSGDGIPYQIYADDSFTDEITPGVAYDYYNPFILGLLGLGGGGNSDFPIYFRTIPTGLNISAGTYTDTISIFWDWEVCILSLFSACIGSDSGTFTSMVTLELVITNDCIITAPNIDFGSAPLVSGFNAITQTISIRCTKGSAFEVGLDDGANASGSQRRMQNSGEFLNYEIYKGPAGTNRWGDTGTERRDSATADTNPGNYDGINGQGFDYHAEISTAQPTPGAGTYTDSIILDVSF